MSSSDFDLWKGAWQILSAHGRRLVPVWMPKDLSAAKSSAEAWRIYHHALTDNGASIMSNPLPDDVQECWQSLVQQNEAQHAQREAVSEHPHVVWAKHAEAEKLARATTG